MNKQLYTFAKEVLLSLIKTPSISGSETETANMLQQILQEHNIPSERVKNNVIARSFHWSSQKPTILLNSHHDTVKPVSGWQTDPFEPICEQGKITGLGSNDAGASLVALLSCFIHYYNQDNLPYNILFVASAEEEISGKQGIEMLVPQLGKIDVAIVGEPTSMNMAIAEKGLLVLDCVAKGIAGHAAHSTGENAIYKAMLDIEWFKSFDFPKKSSVLGPVKMTVTGIQAGKQHNVVPDNCSFMVDVRTNECYTNEEVFDIISKAVQCEVAARSFRLNSSHIPIEHPLVQRGISLGCTTYGSPTLSDQAFLKHIPSVKIGPGDTHRSHTAQEYILETELYQGIDVYIALLDSLYIS